MSESLPRPVPASLPLVASLAAAHDISPLGVWLRVRRPVAAAVRHAGRRRLLLIDGDLGRLLRRCSAIVIRLGARIAAVPAEELIRVRTLRVVAALPYPPTPRALGRPVPDVLRAAASVDIPLGHRSAEEVLAAYATARAPVLFSQVVYRALGPSCAPERAAVDSAPGAYLG